MRNQFKLLLSVLPLMSSACAHAQDQTPSVENTLLATFPANWIPHLLFAFDDFQNTEQELSCFTVSAYRNNESFFVHIAPEAPNTVADDGEILISSGDIGECGFGIRYEFDGDGQFVRITLNR